MELFFFKADSCEFRLFQMIGSLKFVSSGRYLFHYILKAAFLISMF